MQKSSTLWYVISITLLTLTSSVALPSNAAAVCSTPPNRLTKITDQGAASPVSWICAHAETYDFVGICNLNESSPELPDCPLISMDAIMQELQVKDEDGHDFVVQVEACEEYIDCEALREDDSVDWAALSTGCGLKVSHPVLYIDSADEFIQDGDLAVTIFSCGDPSTRSSALLKGGDLTFVKVLRLYSGSSSRVGDHELRSTTDGEPCCDAPDLSEWSYGEENFHRSALKFTVDEVEEWISGPGGAHIFPASGLTLRFNQYVAANDGELVEDFETHLFAEVFAEAPAGFLEVEVGETWCEAWCEEGVVEPDVPDVWTAPDVVEAEDTADPLPDLSYQEDSATQGQDTSHGETDADAANKADAGADTVAAPAETPKSSSSGCNAGADTAPSSLLLLLAGLLLAVLRKRTSCKA